MQPEISFEEFAKVELRSGTIIKAEPFPKARKPAYKIWVDFGLEIGTKQTSAQVTINYTPESLVGKRIIGCVNLGTKNIAGFTSEFLLVGFEDEAGAISLATFDSTVPNGKKLH
ncbi:tRNA-binding protein [Simkania sp.]|uniref:tRNA-binding protein n=1 Tax=Simkania sp. TaxID=34094 RepID=UPI003B52A2BB